MSDIAMLVAEEYERRVKSLRKAGGGGTGAGEFDMVSCVSVMVSRLKEKKQLLQWVWEPKTQVAMAASNSFFSA
ncbi:hypothetical protein AAZX31_05G170000 [Glycine max]|uniref:Uncharacterized protein n=2 Tax=Glycine subgen. Soja TaxID=1462606 RepID=C6T229_SOYBN|nr:uncharacterized protein LOC100500548 [Glycine max]KAG5029722.1 hypothetical protein JHK87_013236 [Glycine soja]ACU15662.1 unknown [Glycine max]KAG5041205.1 hypothetical protein JHK85_013681 [Glycine max]KAG5058343.1 hypothetical protein JHK86_013339 [Glycine max]KAG5155343.1 hypothetical protein JHK82_013312 [Glycine max]|eukprot:XP_025984285.1 uncharacterized protein LOC100500548 [Glycine max]